MFPLAAPYQPTTNISPTNTPGVPKDPQGAGNDDRSQMFYESSGFVAAVVGTVALGLLVLVIILLLLYLCHRGTRKRSVNVETFTSPLPGMPIVDTKPLDSKEKLVSPMTPVEPEDSVSFVEGRASYTKGSSVSTFKPNEGSTKPEGSGNGDGNEKKQDREEKREQSVQKQATKSPENRISPKGNRRGIGNQPGSKTNGPGHNAARRGSGMQGEKAAEGSQSKSRLTAGSSTAKGPSQHLPAVKKPNGAQTQTNNTPGHNAARRGSGMQHEKTAAESKRLTAGSSTAKGPSQHLPAVKKPNGAQTQTNNTPGHNAARRGSGVQHERAAAESKRLTANGSAAKGPSQHTSAAKTPSNGAQTSNGSQRTEAATNRQQQTGNLTQKLTVRRPAPVANSDGGQISKVKSLATTE
jgi:hypothetical protein